MEESRSTLICLPYPNMLFVNSSYAVRKIYSLVEFICVTYTVIFIFTSHISLFQTFPYRGKSTSDNVTYSSSTEEVLVMQGNETVTRREVPIKSILTYLQNPI